MRDRHERDDPSESAGDDQGALALIARHALHDEEIVAALAAGALDSDDEPSARARARGLVERCQVCRAVHDDVLAIGAATRASAAFTANAPRDFRLTAADARRLGGPVIAAGVLGRFRLSILRLGGPIGASLMAFGMVGVVIGSMWFGSGVTSAPERDGTAGVAATESPGEGQLGPLDTYPKSTDVGTRSDTSGVAGRAAGAWLLLVATGLLALGFVLLAVSFRAARARNRSNGIR